MSETFGIDLDALSLAELNGLQKSVEKAIRNFEARRLTKARTELEAHAKELGVKLEDILSVSATPSRQPIAGKYRDPKDASNVWSGRGRRPAWFVAALAAGATVEDLLID